MKNKRHSVGTSLLTVIFFGLLLAGAHAQAQQKPDEIKDRLGTYEIFLTTNSENHDSAQILVMRTGKANSHNTFGMAFGTNKGTENTKGDGLVCEQAILLLDRTVLTCTNILRNSQGRAIGEETLVVGVTGSPFCEALRASLLDENKDKIADTSDDNCNEEDGKECICYQLKGRGTVDFGPPSGGSGSGRR